MPGHAVISGEHEHHSDMSIMESGSWGLSTKQLISASSHLWERTSIPTSELRRLRLVGQSVKETCPRSLS